MSLIIVKSEFHQLIDSIEDKDLLVQFMEALQHSATRKEGELWKTLTETQQEKVLKSYDESLNEENLISAETIAQKHQKWLTK